MRVICALLCLAALTGPTAAQEFGHPVPGITVTGRATLLAHADVLYVFESLTSAPNGPSDIDGASAAVVAALQSAGAISASTGDVIDGHGLQGRSITATVREPTPAGLTKVSQAIAEALQRFPGTVQQSFMPVLGLTHCEEVEGRLHAIAIADSRARAQRLANAAGVNLGAPTAIAPGALAGYFFPCSPSRARPLGVATTLPEDGNVEFGLYVNVTYSIVSRSGAT
jgi:uncharacterized protein YggE